MGVWCRWIWLLLLLLSATGAFPRSFPSTPDVTEAAQQQWGTVQPGYVTEGCWHGASGTPTVQVQPCRAFALATQDPPGVQGFSETLRSVTYSGGDGRYWLAGRASPGVTAPGWTCGDGVHYCWLKGETTPPVPSALVLLGTTTVSSGQTAALTILAPWKRSTPYTVPPGVTLTFGVCPDVGAQPLFVATGTGSGLVRFAAGSCRSAYPEWWGADPTGLSDSSAAWQAAVDAASGYGAPAPNEFNGPIVPLLCSGTYAISATAPNRAITLRSNTQILGTARPAGGGNPQMPCRFNFTGTGTALGMVDINSTYARVRLDQLQLYDVNDTGATGLALNGFAASEARNIVVRRFDVGVYLGTGLYYSEVTQVRVFGQRTIGVDIAGVANDALVDVQCNTTTNTTQQYCVRVGQTPGEFGTSGNLRLHVLSEISSGLPISIDRVRALDLTAYLENPGNGANYSPLANIALRRIDGGRVHLRAIGNVSGGPAIPYGLRFFAAPDEATGQHNKNIVVSGMLQRYTTPIYIEAEPGGWGINTTGLALGTDAATGQELYPVFTTGLRLARNYLTHGDAPTVDQGRGATLGGSNWVQGDLIFATPQGDGRIGNLLRQVTGPGNPPTVMQLLIPTLSAVRLLDGEAVAQLLTGNTYATRLIVETSGTALSDVQPYIPGLCLNVLAVGARTITHSALIRLAGGANYAMSGGNTLYLCRDDPNGPWREYGRCSTCS